MKKVIFILFAVIFITPGTLFAEENNRIEIGKNVTVAEWEITAAQEDISALKICIDFVATLQNVSRIKKEHIQSVSLFLDDERIQTWDAYFAEEKLFLDGNCDWIEVAYPAGQSWFTIQKGMTKKIRLVISFRYSAPGGLSIFPSFGLYKGDISDHFSSAAKKTFRNKENLPALLRSPGWKTKKVKVGNDVIVGEWIIKAGKEIFYPYEVCIDFYPQGSSPLRAEHITRIVVESESFGQELWESDQKTFFDKKCQYNWNLTFGIPAGGSRKIVLKVDFSPDAPPGIGFKPVLGIRELGKKRIFVFPLKTKR